MTLGERIAAAQEAYRKALYEVEARDRELQLLFEEARKVWDERIEELRKSSAIAEERPQVIT